MKNSVTLLIFAATALVAVLAGIGAQSWLETGSVRPDLDQASTSSTQTVNTENIHRPNFSLPDLDGQTREVSEWDDKILVVNFWATWCPPCRKEMPAFIELQAAYQSKGIQFVGIAMDRSEPVKTFADELKINYPILLAEIESASLSKQYGNNVGALPYTAIVNRSGTIVHTFAGEVKKFELEQLLNSLL